MVTPTLTIGNNATQSAVSADVYARVERQMMSQNAGALKLNAALTRDQAKLSGLGQLQSALAEFQSLARGLSGAGLSSSVTASANSVVQAAGPGSAARDAGQTGANLTGLVAAYNGLNAKLQALQKGDLKSDTALGQVGSSLTQILRTTANSSALRQAGISVAANGALQLDQDKLKSALAADPQALGKLFADNGRGIADQLAAKIDALTGTDSLIKKEVAGVGKEISALNGKKAVLAKALTAQASALASLYAQQEKSGTSGPQSLFDFLA